MSSSKKDLKIYNSLTSKKEVFKTVNDKMVGMYVCGPTVYNTVHLGNCRTFISFDLIFRYLKHIGYKVRYVRNITDVGHLEDDSQEDKISKRAAIEKLEPMEIVQKYTNNFRNILQKFNLLPPNIEPTATGHIIEQIQMIKKIIENGFAYEKNGSVYFDLKQFNKKYKYGSLSNRNLEELIINQFINLELVKSIFPEATSYGEVDKDTLAIPVYKEKEEIGYLFETYDIPTSMLKYPVFSIKPEINGSGTKF